MISNPMYSFYVCSCNALHMNPDAKAAGKTEDKTDERLYSV